MQIINSISLLKNEPSAYSDCACSFSEEVKQPLENSLGLLSNEPSAYHDCACAFSEEIETERTNVFHNQNINKVKSEKTE